MHILKYLAPLVLGLSSLCSAQTTQDYIRYQPGLTEEDGALQVAVESFTRGNVTVDLYGVVHMADRDYYQGVQQELAGYDTVLYEGVKRGTDANVETKGLNLIQQGMAKILGLEFQMKEIDYSGANMVHADIDLETLQASLGDQQLSPLDGLFTPEQISQIEPIIQFLGDFLDQWLEGDSEYRNQLKQQFAEQLSTTDIEQQLPEQMRKAILDDRNDIVMAALDEQLQNPATGRIAIFYGAGHNPDFSRRLTRLGFASQGKTWRSAWVLGRGVSGQESQFEAPLQPDRCPTCTERDQSSSEGD